MYGFFFDEILWRMVKKEKSINNHEFRHTKKKLSQLQQLLSHIHALRSFHFAGSQTRSTNIHLLGAAINLDSYRLNIGFPHLIGTSM